MSAVPSTPSGAPALGATGLVVAGLVCQEIGAAFAVTLFPAVGAVGMVSLRLAFSAAILMLLFRPTVRGRSCDDWMTVVVFGLSLAGMNVLFYEALARLSLGVTVTIEVLGPLILSVVISRRASSWLWAVLAFVGVALLGREGFDSLDPIGVLFAAGAGALWVAYILLSARTGRRFEKLDGLALAMTVAALVVVPFGALTAGAAIIRPQILLLGLAVAILSSTIPYGLELLALRRLTAATFSILLSLAPVLAALAGLLILRQALTLVDLLAMLLVVAASMGAVRAASRRFGPTITEVTP
jgi:inner membrane transporter RhtA